MQDKGLAWLRKVSSFTQSRIILTANNYRIFDLLEVREETSEVIARIIDTDPRATGLLLNSLVAIGLVEKKGNLYHNAPIASRYLVRGNTDYQGDILSHCNILWDNWSGLDAVIKTGRPYRKSHDHKSFILGMHNLALQKVKEVMAHMSFDGVRTLLDLGGGPGTYSMAFAKKKIGVTLFDFPATLAIAKKLIADAGLQKKIKLLPGDFTNDKWGEGYDMVFISQIFHAYSPDECLTMLKKTYAALNPGGRVVIQEFYLDDTRANPPQGAIFAINMLVNTQAGRTYTSKEMMTWMKKARFSGIEEKNLGETVLITGTKK